MSTELSPWPAPRTVFLRLIGLGESDGGALLPILLFLKFSKMVGALWALACLLGTLLSTWRAREASGICSVTLRQPGVCPLHTPIAISHVLLTGHKTRVAAEMPGDTGKRRRHCSVCLLAFS